MGKIKIRKLFCSRSTSQIFNNNAISSLLSTNNLGTASSAGDSMSNINSRNTNTITRSLFGGTKTSVFANISNEITLSNNRKIPILQNIENRNDNKINNIGGGMFSSSNINSTVKGTVNDSALNSSSLFNNKPIDNSKNTTSLFSNMNTNTVGLLNPNSTTNIIT